MAGFGCGAALFVCLFLVWLVGCYVVYFCWLGVAWLLFASYSGSFVWFVWCNKLVYAAFLTGWGMVGLRLWDCSLIVLFIVISFCFVLNLFANLWFNLIALCSVYDGCCYGLC